MTVVPVGDRLLVKPDEVPGKSSGGIIIPDEAKEKSMFGTVIAWGKKLENFIEGQRVCFGKWAGQQIEIDDAPYLIIRFDDILAVE